MEQNKQDIQRFMQIREEIHQEIEKIPPIVLQLQEMTNRFVGHFKIFETLSQNAQDQLKATIRNASFEMADLASEEFMKRIESQVQRTLSSLDQSVIEAKEVLGKVSRGSFLKMTFLITLLILLSLSTGFILGGYYYENKSHRLIKSMLENANMRKKDF